MPDETPKQEVMKAESKGEFGITDKDKRIGKFWENNIKRAKKAKPVKHWERAKKRYKADCTDPKTDDTRPMVNDLRKQHESSMAFLDQIEPSFKISPSEGFISDPVAQKQAECESKYIKYVWKEQKCQKAESRKLNSAILLNIGSTLVEFDFKKWMPSLRFIPADNILIDADCGGITEKANWKGYFEDIPPEEFKSWHSDMSDEMMKAILKKAGSVLDKEQQKDVSDAESDMFMAIRVYHIFARNAYAVREEKEGGEVKIPEKRIAEQLQLDTPRRYIQMVEGWPAPIVDENKWPFDLDHDEFPTTDLQFNQTNDDIYGFTDYQQMSRLDELGDDVMKNIGWATYWAAMMKFLSSSNQQVDKAQLDDFLNNPKTSWLPDMLDAAGIPKLKPMERGHIDIAQMEAYKLIHDQAKEAITMKELLEYADVQMMKDVTAIGIRVWDANIHQKINRRLGGPWGYEESIGEDVVKMLEVAHQFVPNFSQVAVMEEMPILDEMQQPIIEFGIQKTGNKEVLKDLPWNEALVAIANGGQLIKLGIDTIVGIELAQFWPYKQPSQQWRLSTKVIVEPGTTRSITKEQNVAILKQLYAELFQPFYQAIGRLDLARSFLEMIGRMAAVPAIDTLLPSDSEIKGWLAAQQQALITAGATSTGTTGKTGEAGGQPLNSPEATGGEVQEQT